LHNSLSRFIMCCIAREGRERFPSQPHKLA